MSYTQIRVIMLLQLANWSRTEIQIFQPVTHLAIPSLKISERLLLLLNASSANSCLVNKPCAHYCKEKLQNKCFKLVWGTLFLQSTIKIKFNSIKYLIKTFESFLFIIWHTLQMCHVHIIARKNLGYIAILPTVGTATGGEGHQGHSHYFPLVCIYCKT